MRSFGGISAVLAGFLLLSLSIKVAVAGPEPEDSPQAHAALAAGQLRTAGFQARILRLSRSPAFLTIARRSDCTVLAGAYPPHSTFRDVWHDLAASNGDRLRFAWRGRFYDREPKLGSLFAFYRWREFKRIGVDTDRAPVIAVATSAGCSDAMLPWT